MTSLPLRGAVGQTLTLVLWQIRYEQRAFWRDRRRAIFSFMFPLMMLLLFGSLNQHSTCGIRNRLNDTRQRLVYQLDIHHAK